MEKFENNPIVIESQGDGIKNRTWRHKLFRSIPMIIAAVITMITSYMMINDHINVDTATIIVIVCVIGMVLSIVFIDRSGI